MTREELVARLAEVRARRAELDAARRLSHDEIVERAELKAEQLRIEGQLSALSKQALSVTDRAAIRAAIGFVRDEDPALARQLDEMINRGKS